MAIIDWLRNAGNWLLNNIARPVGAGLMTGVGKIARFLSPGIKAGANFALDRLSSLDPTGGALVAGAKDLAGRAVDSAAAWGDSYQNNIARLGGGQPPPDKKRRTM